MSVVSFPCPQYGTEDNTKGLGTLLHLCCLINQKIDGIDSSCNSFLWSKILADALLQCITVSVVSIFVGMLENLERLGTERNRK